MTDFRFNPFTFEYRPKNLPGEVKTVQHFPAFNRVGFFLSETPQRLNSSPITIVCGGDTLGEVGRPIVPDVNNFRVDYGNQNNYASIGFVEVHASRIGQVATINSRGLGANLNSSHRSDARDNMQRSVSVAGAVSVGGTTVDPDIAINANLKRIQNIGAAISADDAATLAAGSLSINSRRRLFISGAVSGSTGTFTPPPNTRYVFLYFSGAGGAGSAAISGTPGAGGGGGGSSVSFAIIDLSLISGPFSWLVSGPTSKNFTGSEIAGDRSQIFGCSSGRGRGGTFNSISKVGTGGVSNTPTFSAAAIYTRDYAGVAGGNNATTTGGAGGSAGVLNGELLRFLTVGISGGAGGIGNQDGANGLFPGCGGGAGGGALADTVGGAGGGGFIYLLF